MLNQIIAFCLRNRLLVVAAGLVVAVVGADPEAQFRRAELL